MSAMTDTMSKRILSERIFVIRVTVKISSKSMLETIKFTMKIYSTI